MSKFNSTTTKTPDSTNMAGGIAFSRDDFRMEVASTILNTMLNGDSYYENEVERLERIESMLVNEDHSKFLAKAMVYVRNEGNLRSISHFMGVVLAEKTKGTTFLRKALEKTIIRPDDMTEMLALWNTRNPNKMLPNSIRRSFKSSLENKFDMYQFKKYEGKNKKVKLRDVVKISHPSAERWQKGDNSEVFKMIIEGRLPNIETVQTVNANSTGEYRSQSYSRMLKERKLGYMGALKNIKNILESGADTGTINALCDLISNENAVRNSRVLPFRFTQAYEIVNNMSIDRINAKQVLNAIEQGFIYSAKNVPIVEEGQKVAILLDESGSMGGWNVSRLTDKSPFMIGKTLMASMLTGLDKDKTVGYLWADSAREVSIDGSPMNFMKRTQTKGGGTDLSGAIDDLVRTGTFVDVITIFTDMQQNNFMHGRRSNKNIPLPEMITKYRKINPNVKVVFWNLEGYGGGTPMKLDHNILEISGYSDKLLSLIPKMFKDKNAFIEEIEKIEI